MNPKEMNHTPEPWEVSEESVTVKAGGEVIADTYGGLSDYDYDSAIADARRIVACVNACAGVPTEVLEANIPPDWMEPQAVAELVRAARSLVIDGCSTLNEVRSKKALIVAALAKFEGVE